VSNRVRVFFINCPRLAVDAASFLVLAQNKVQKAIQFEVYHYWIFAETKSGRHFNAVLSWLEINIPTLGGWLWRSVRARQERSVAPVFKKNIQHNIWIKSVKQAVADHDEWLSQSGYNMYDVTNCQTIVITETPIAGQYLSLSEANIGIVSTSTWKIYFRPASALEYVLTSVQRLSLRLTYGVGIGSHFPTRGCIWDFDVHQPDFRISAFLGFLCQTCSGALGKVASAEHQKDIHTLLANEWIGNGDNASSIASILTKNYKYDLWRSTGLSPNLLSLIRSSVKDGLGRAVFDAMKWIVIALVTIFLASQFPSAFSILHGGKG